MNEAAQRLESNPSPKGPRALRILAKSVFRELKSSGYSRSDIVAFSTEMLSLVSSELRDGDSSVTLIASKEEPLPAE